MTDNRKREDRPTDPEIARRETVLREELERRLDFLETSDDSVFGEFTTLDWIVCTLLFFVLPLLILGFMAL
jgi:hypothetical protein